MDRDLRFLLNPEAALAITLAALEAALPCRPEIDYRNKECSACWNCQLRTICRTIAEIERKALPSMLFQAKEDLRNAREFGDAETISAAIKEINHINRKMKKEF